ncbi:hypothetical protein [Deinococcus multiflagellatus]|uniref:Uncharacterized protein n=1 Tax=Deinococcus multiflagellatus TaxID=1656887 RepID=A0ABW1ZTW9_9DEIO
MRTVLILNELTRFEPMYLGAMIGALDDVDEATLRQMGAAPTRAAPARYYALRLPNGELISAPVDTLSVIGTTNIGQDYQAAQELDAALLRRFDRHVDVPYADELRTAAVISSKCSHPGLATAAAHLELRSRMEVQGAGPGHEGLLARELNPAVSAALAMEALDLHMRQGLSLPDAFVEAAEVTAVPFCVPRTLSGAQDGSALARFQDLVREVAEGLAVLPTALPAQPRRGAGPAFAPLPMAGA